MDQTPAIDSSLMETESNRLKGQHAFLGSLTASSCDLMEDVSVSRGQKNSHKSQLTHFPQTSAIIWRHFRQHLIKLSTTITKAHVMISDLNIPLSQRFSKRGPGY